METYRINRNNTEIHYEYLRSNAETEETLILLHGNGLDSQSWYKVLDGLLEYYNILMYDFPGQGRSPLKTTLPSWRELCEDLKLLTGHLHIHTYHLIGHGAGGNLAIIHTNIYPDDVKTLCIISTPCFFPVSEIQKYIDYRKKLVHDFGKNRLIEYMLPKITVLGELSPEWLTLRRGYEAVSLEMHFHFYNLVAKTDWITELKKIKTPTLVISGENDPIFTPYPSLVTSCFLENSEYVNIHDASNMVFIDKPEETLRYIHRFIDNTGPSPSTVEQDILGLLHKKSRQLFTDYQHQPLVVRPIITMKLIGEFSISINNTRIEQGLNKRNAKNLLLYFSFYKTAAREQILEDFWPEINLLDAQNQLRVSLNYLKRIFKDYNYLEIYKAERAYVSINADVKSDVHELYRILMNDSFHENRVSLETILFNYASFFGNRNYLIGFSDEWSVKLKYMLANRMHYWAERLTDYYKDEGNAHMAACFEGIQRTLEGF
jgi:Predicted hydrolases or acyltransferases (alpha/beta hydrolase superfamily)